MTDHTAVDRMFDALARGDVAAARATCTPDARIWHGFDGQALDLDGIAEQWAALIAATAERGIADVRRQPTPDGLVQQHLFFVRPAGGQRKVWPVCVVVRLKNGLIARLDEYIDRAGSYAVADDEPLATPGF